MKSFIAVIGLIIRIRILRIIAIIIIIIIIDNCFYVIT